MTAAIIAGKEGITGECRQKAKKNKGKVIRRTDLMSILLRDNVDYYIKKQVSNLCDMILDMEKKDKTYITQIQISYDSEKELLDFLKNVK